jgi:hypothetical protein
MDRRSIIKLGVMLAAAQGMPSSTFAAAERFRVPARLPLFFDAAFFDELATLNDSTVRAIASTVGDRLTISDLRRDEIVGKSFADTTDNFVATLARRSNNRYRFSKDFRVYPGCVTSFCEGRESRKHFEISFVSYPQWGEHYAAIGLGFAHENTICSQGIDDYAEFLAKVQENPGHFDTTFGSLGAFAQPTSVYSGPITAIKVVALESKYERAWGFFGRRLSVGECAAFGSINDFVDECIRVFDAIASAGF